ncbi:TetR/AcrR family transcriptional regulator [Pseudonocardiaceae bacterium YIM PH 21723]|nr:TetR/AcrR family transcriptional regulator [Pseudonocardiaceae bacterium YIM PH 21723]
MIRLAVTFSSAMICPSSSIRAVKLTGMSSMATSSGGADRFLATLPRHRHGLTREEVLNSQRGRLLAATAATIAEHGYASANVREITQRAGVSRKTFYELFQDKEDAFLACFSLALEDLINSVVGAMSDLAAYADPPALAEAAFSAMLNSLAEQPDFTRMFFLEALGAGPRVRLRRDEVIDEITRLTLLPMNALREAETPSRPELDHEDVLMFIGGGHELIVHHLARHEPATLPELLPRFVRRYQRI